MKLKLFVFWFAFLSSFCYITYAQPSFLDSAFGANGVVITTLNNSESGSFTSVIVKPDHKIISGGSMICRYNEDGTLDNSFAVHGIITGMYSHGLALQSDGKILTVYGEKICCLNINGMLDNTFGNGGIDSTINFWPDYGGSAIALQPDGKIIIAGISNSTSLGVGRLLPNGIADSTFGSNGLVIISAPDGQASGVVIMPDGRIVVAGSSTFYQSFMTVRFQPDGTIDTSFNHTGIVLTNAGDYYSASGSSIQLQNDGKVVVAGNARYTGQGLNFVLLRYDTNGTLDRTFGDTGVVNIDFNDGDDEATALCIAGNGQIIVAGFANSRFGLTRINSNGNIDSSFGNNGEIISTIQDGNDIPRALALQYDKKIVVAGSSYNNVKMETDPTLARYIAVPSARVLQLINHSGKSILFPNPSAGVLYFNQLSPS
jgi:uncharacterized delta-60 repeat protein